MYTLYTLYITCTIYYTHIDDIYIHIMHILYNIIPIYIIQYNILYIYNIYIQASLKVRKRNKNTEHKKMKHMLTQKNVKNYSKPYN